MIQIPKIFKGEDIVYHYTKATTAVEHIFYKNRLKFSSISNSIDTIEGSKFNTGTVFFGEHNEDIYKRNHDNLDMMEKRIYSLLDEAKILCFCKNDTENKYLSSNIYKKDYYGFLKPRMWDQYGENYKGVCLALSKTKLIENNLIECSQDIKYVEYDEFELNFNRISLNYLDKVGLDSYYSDIRSSIVETFSKKHKDYKDENEFRILTFSEKEKFVDITKSVCGIIISPKLIQSEFIHNQIIQYSKEMNIELLYLDWNKNGVTITSRDFWEELKTDRSDIHKRWRSPEV